MPIVSVNQTPNPTRFQCRRRSRMGHCKEFQRRQYNSISVTRTRHINTVDICHSNKGCRRRICLGLFTDICWNAVLVYVCEKRHQLWGILTLARHLFTHVHMASLSKQRLASNSSSNSKIGLVSLIRLASLRECREECLASEQGCLI